MTPRPRGLQTGASEGGWVGAVRDHPMTNPAAQNQILMVIDLLEELESGLSSSLF